MAWRKASPRVSAESARWRRNKSVINSRAEAGCTDQLGFGASGGVACGENHPVGIELERENLLHGQQPVAFHARDVRRGQRQSRLCEPVEIAGHEPMGGKGNDPLMRKIERLDVLLVGGFAEVKRFGRIGFERFRH